MSQPSKPAAPAGTPIPPDVAQACGRGLQLLPQYQPGVPPSVKKRAEQLAAGVPISKNMLGRLRTYHDKPGPPCPPTSEATIDHVPALLAGGAAARGWLLPGTKAPATPAATAPPPVTPSKAEKKKELPRAKAVSPPIPAAVPKAIAKQIPTKGGTGKSRTAATRAAVALDHPIKKTHSVMVMAMPPGVRQRKATSRLTQSILNQFVKPSKK